MEKIFKPFTKQELEKDYNRIKKVAISIATDENKKRKDLRKKIENMLSSAGDYAKFLIEFNDLPQDDWMEERVNEFISKNTSKYSIEKNGYLQLDSMINNYEKDISHITEKDGIIKVSGFCITSMSNRIHLNTLVKLLKFISIHIQIRLPFNQLGNYEMSSLSEWHNLGDIEYRVYNKAKHSDVLEIKINKGDMCNE